tara:strand:+ start:1562 stop:1900 length:339 start_codon:yes stop_codon:yes gene_type:complete
MQRIAEINDLPDELYCPACGKPILPRPMEPCEHLLFVYLEGVCYDPTGIGEKFEEILLDDDSDGEPQTALEKVDLPETAFVLSITSYGMACGPVSSTILYCFDLLPKEGEPS